MPFTFQGFWRLHFYTYIGKHVFGLKILSIILLFWKQLKFKKKSTQNTLKLRDCMYWMFSDRILHIHICVLNTQLHITRHCHCLSELSCSNLLRGSGSLCFAASKGPFIYQINADSSAQPCSAAEWRCRLVREKYTAFLEKNEHWNLSNRHFCDQPALKAPIQQHRPSSLGLLF